MNQELYKEEPIAALKLSLLKLSVYLRPSSPATHRVGVSTRSSICAVCPTSTHPRSPRPQLGQSLIPHVRYIVHSVGVLRCGIHLGGRHRHFTPRFAGIAIREYGILYPHVELADERELLPQQQNHPFRKLISELRRFTSQCLRDAQMR